MKTCLILGTVVLLSLAGVASLAADAPDESKPSFWMQKKLQYSEAILAALVHRDFDQVAKTAHSMGALSRIEKWVHANTKEYRAQLQAFKNANDQLEQMADEKNLEGAALAYVQLNLTCIHCHKVVRDAPHPTPTADP